MKKVTFVLYANQLMSITYLGGLSTRSAKKLEESLFEQFSDDYDITFKWEESIKNNSVDAIILPEPFPPIVNNSDIPVIKVPAPYFIQNKIEKVKEIVDAYFNEN